MIYFSSRTLSKSPPGIKNPPPLLFFRSHHEKSAYTHI